MDKLKQLIRTIIEEKEYDLPEEISSALKDKLLMNPLKRYVDYFKAVNSIPPSYRIFLHNGQFFDIVYESFSLMAKIKGREYYLADLDERHEAVEEINRLLTLNQMVPDKAGEAEKEMEDIVGGDEPPKTTGNVVSPAPAADEPEEDES